MATAYPTNAQNPAPARASWLPTAASVAMTSAFAYLAFRLSFTALTDLAMRHGVAADVVWMFAVLVDGGAVVGTVGVIMAQRTGRPARAYWATVVSFAAVSLAFNIAHSDGTPLGVAIAITPPAAQLVATELLVRILPAPRVEAAVTAPTAPDAVTRTVVEEARAATDAARGATAQATAAAAMARDATRQVSVDGVGGQPAADIDLAALVAAVDEEPPDNPAAGDDAGVPEPLPLAVTFSAPPLPTGGAPDGTEEGAEASDVPREWIETYQRVERESGRRPTQQTLGDALGVKRSRASQIRTQVEAVINTPCVVTFP